MSLEVASLWLPILIALVACLYSSVGHGGASGYLAVLALTTMAAKSTSATALTLNLIVATIAFVAFRQADYFSWKLTWPFIVGAAPFALIGSLWRIPDRAYYLLVGIIVLCAGLKLLATSKGEANDQAVAPPSPWIGIAVGAAVGLLSGVVGIGGGIFLSPIIVLSKWADAKVCSATSAIFIVSNSAIGLWTRAQQGIQYPESIVWLLIGGAAGSLAGSWMGAHQFDRDRVRRYLGIVLVLASIGILAKSLGAST